MVIRTIYCPRCATLQGVKDWRERQGNLVLELEPCGHVVERCARMEWETDEVAAA
jgi:Zn ribbon nucleic-acid-binding protein